MKKLINVFALLVLLSVTSHAQEDKCLGPYFLVEGNEQSFPLLANQAKVNITGPIANVKITQSYKNNGENPINAIYVFPASTRAAVHHMRMIIGDRIVEAEVMKKQEARQTYQKAKSEGKRASLLEQERPNVFQMQLANLMPGEQIDIELFYTEFLICEDQEYEFVYPTVVGPRFSGEKSETYSNMPYKKAGQAPDYDFGIDIRINTEMDIQKIYSSSHGIKTNTERSFTDVNLLDKEKSGGNRDFILNYQLAGEAVNSQLHVFNNGEESFFLAQIEPPSLECMPEIIPREYIFILDVSGSMGGYPLQVSKTLMRNLFKNLRAHDKFNIMLFAGSANVLFEQSQEATEQNKQMAFDVFDKERSGGGTYLINALNKALAIPKVDHMSRSFVIVTDGFVTVDEEALQLIHSRLNQANFFAFGIGSSVNRSLIEGMAHVGGADAFIVTQKQDANREADKLRKYIETPVMTDIKIEANDVTLYDLVTDQIPDLMARRPIYCFGKFKNNHNGTIKISGRQGHDIFSRELSFKDSNEDDALVYLWAREKIRFLDDFNGIKVDQKRINTVTDIGLKYNLLTKYTSFVAVDEQIATNTPSKDVVKQRLPMPARVNNSAIGFEMEIPELVVDDKIKTKINIDLDCHELLTKTILEELIEQWAKQIEIESLIKLKNKEIRLIVKDGKDIFIEAKDDNLIKLEKYLKVASSKLQLELSSGEYPLIIKLI